MRRAVVASIAAAVIPLASPTPAAALSLEPIAPPGTFGFPTHVTSRPDDPSRLFVAEQNGTVKLVQGGTVRTYLDIGSLVSCCGERGLLSMAFAPDHATSGLFYVFYTRSDGDLQIDEFTASGDAVDPASRRSVLTIEHSAEGNHNGGQLQFGPGGYLYLSTGDGGGQGDPGDDAQSLDSLLGKLLRIDPRGSGDGDYTVPVSNPFVGAAGLDEIWSYGLRNPWRFSFDMQTGALLIGDVGGSVFEEVNYDPAPDAGQGLNFGWNCREGTGPGPDDGDAHCAPPFTDPIHQYSTIPHPAAITGGYVARDTGLPELTGRYLYADYFDGEIRSLIPGFPASGDRSEGVTVPGLSSFGEDACGGLYAASQTDGAVYRLRGPGETACPPGVGVGAGTSQSCRGEPATIVGDRGNDVVGTGGRDVVVGSDGADRINTGPGPDLVCSGAGADRVHGGGGKDEVRAGAGKDRVAGRGGKDRLNGGRGKDRLNGGAGRDRCTGGPGRDRKISC